MAVAILISGLDDFVVDLAFALNWLKRRSPQKPPAPAPERPIAVFVPL
jgi:hypothetical protein